MAKKKKEFIKVKKKKWVEVIAPDMFNKQQIGESHVEESTSLIGRQLKINLMTLTRDIKKQNINAFFKIAEIKENKAFTKIIGFTMVPAAVRRLVRRRRNKIENSVILTSKDDISFRIKPIIITHNKISKAVATDMSTLLLNELKEVVAKTPYTVLLSMILANKLQREIKSKLSKIVPTRVVEIRYAKEVAKK